MNEPEIRFTDKDGKQYSEWEEKKLGEVTVQTPSSTLTADKLIEGGHYPVWNGGRTPYGYCDKFNNNNALVIASRGEAGHPTYVKGKFWAGGLCYPMIGDKKHDTSFLANTLLAHEMQFRRELVSQTSIPAVNKSDVLDYQINCASSLSEQHDIGSFFSFVDEKIKTEEAKTESLTKAKSALLDGMFLKDGESVPRIRFDGFTNPWEQRKLGDVAKFINGRAYAQDELLPSGKYKVLRVGNFYTNDSWYYSDLELDDKYYANDGDLLYTWSATFGPHIWHGGKVIYHYHIWKIDLSDELEKHFAVQLLERDKNDILSGHNGSTMAHITKEGMEQKEVIIPSSIEEQRQLGMFFESLDNLITLHQREYEKWRDIKAALLQHMF